MQASVLLVLFSCWTLSLWFPVQSRSTSVSNCTISTKGRMAQLHCKKPYRNQFFQKAPVGVTNLKIILDNTVEINKINFDGIRNIYHLIIDAKSLTSIKTNVLDDFTSLRRLCILNTRIYSLPGYPFARLESLLILQISGNYQLTTLHRFTFAGLKNLLTLRLSRNNINSLDKNTFANLSKLQMLDLSQNNVTSIDQGLLMNIWSLRDLSLERNKILSLHNQTFSKLPRLLSLDLAHNRLSFLPAYIFLSMEKLIRLHLENNTLALLGRNTFTGLKNVQKVYLSHNQFHVFQSELFFELKSISLLNLSSNKIKTFSNSSNLTLPNLLILDLSNNHLRKLEKRMLFGTKVLFHFIASNNPLKEISDRLFQGQTILTNLQLKNCKLTNISKLLFSGLRKLRRLDLSGNGITFLHSTTFKDLIKLKCLYLNDNVGLILSTELFQPLINLYKLHLANLSLQSIPKKTFHHLSNLQELYIQNNLLTSLDSLQLCELKKLIRLNVSGNKLTTFHKNQFFCLKDINLSRNREQFIDIRKNPIQCTISFISVFENLSRRFFLRADCILNGKRVDASRLSQEVFIKEMALPRSTNVHLNHTDNLMYSLSTPFYIVIDLEINFSRVDQNKIDFIDSNLLSSTTVDYITIIVSDYLEICYGIFNACIKISNLQDRWNKLEMVQRRNKKNLTELVMMMNGAVIRTVYSFTMKKDVHLTITEDKQRSRFLSWSLNLYSENAFRITATNDIKWIHIVLETALVIVLIIITAKVIQCVRRVRNKNEST